MVDPGAGLSPTIERLLAAAANDHALRDDLLRDRLGAARRGGFELTEAERAVLTAVPEERLQALLAALAARAKVSPAPPVACLQITGVRPDVPHVQGIRPDRESPVRGTRPGRLLAAAAATAAIGGGVVYVAARATSSEHGDAAPPAPRAPEQEPGSAPTTDASPPGDASVSPSSRSGEPE